MFGDAFKIISLTGKFGSGKTALAVHLFSILREEIGCPLWTNFDMEGCTPIHTIAELYTLFDGLILLDEMQTTAHSRSAMSKQNSQLLDWFDQVRKQGCVLGVISQELSKMDRIIRSMIDYELACRYLGGGLSEVNTFALIDGEPARRVSSSVVDIRPAWGKYNTRQRAWRLDRAPDEVGARAGRRAG
jgi:energy-coupling factor transporter ATP-binding protein EcfA2